ncbi:hypothetical protein THAOC_30857, partial [Thalassiosira oceanica]
PAGGLPQEVSPPPGLFVSGQGCLHARRGSEGQQALCAYGGRRVDNELDRRGAFAYGGAYSDRRACGAFKYSGAYTGRWPYGAFACGGHYARVRTCSAFVYSGAYAGRRICR